MVLVTDRHKEEVLEALKEWAGAEEEGLNVLAIDADRDGLKEISVE
jgi:hypothetical protein